MTIGIGALCEGGTCVVLASDTRASYGLLTEKMGTHNMLGKQFDFHPAFNLYAAIAGTVCECQSFVSELNEQFKKIPKETAQLEHFIRAILETQWHTWQPICDQAMRFTLAITLDQWRAMQKMKTTLYRAGRKLIKHTDLPVELIVGGFLGRRRPVLLRMLGKERVEEEVNWTVIGSGTVHSLAHLNRRDQHVHMSFQRTVLHVAEALDEAKKDRDVGEPSDYVVVTADGPQRFKAKSVTVGRWKEERLGRGTDDLDGNKAARDEIMKDLYPYVSPHA